MVLLSITIALEILCILTIFMVAFSVLREHKRFRARKFFGYATISLGIASLFLYMQEIKTNLTAIIEGGTASYFLPTVFENSGLSLLDLIGHAFFCLFWFLFYTACRFYYRPAPEDTITVPFVILLSLHFLSLVGWFFHLFGTSFPLTIMGYLLSLSSYILFILLLLRFILTQHFYHDFSVFRFIGIPFVFLMIFPFGLDFLGIPPIWNSVFHSLQLVALTSIILMGRSMEKNLTIKL